MFNNFKISQRLVIISTIFIFILLSVAGLGLFFLKEEAKNVTKINTNIQIVTDSQNLRLLINDLLITKAFKVEAKIDSWQEALEALTVFDLEFKKIIDHLKENSNESQAKKLSDVASLIVEPRVELEALYDDEDRQQLALFLKEKLDILLNKPAKILATEASQAEIRANEVLLQSDKDAQNAFIIMLTLSLFGLLFSIILAWIVTKSISTPINKISEVVTAVSNGDYTQRTEMETGDEIGQLGGALDTLLDERLSDLALIEKESEDLNESVISLLMTVSKLSERDLTAKALVTADATGPVADALNLMTSETATVLLDVRKIADIVKQSSIQVNQQALNVRTAGDQQQQEITYTAENLSEAAKTLSVIAKIADQANNLANNTAETTTNASKAVTSTVDSMEQIKDAIQETGGRIKRLNERAQEISGIVNVINVIAKRTSVLALNASMQAAAAGEAGRGFAVVADEVQRLAESSRQATSQIETLIKNILIEITGSMTTMDSTIEQVIEGSRLAEKAGRAMTNTLSSTEHLVTSVAEISESSKQQSSIAQKLLERATEIRQRSEETGEQLVSQLDKTKQLVDYAEQLLNSVSIFRLPEIS